ncbi:type I-F CRISPR-associated protein Csy3 [Iodobacter sp. HSC-16F04]|uniref:Type I-F CRISPR-associated protein Csy3 n=1 Tax=Iodobacter violaceini TaxID=3044271 RepID=A0ABX0KV27_9NEIS|nr:type I-F CRISPR-associated protein Csy3 [Iodobacter violacea]NHQ87827.1 type I-F CRISPR-associated protein Csy3 [Iodobacter violacea]
MAIKTASVLAFERKLSNSDAVMHAGKWEERAISGQWPALAILSKDVRGTISNRLKNAVASDPAKLDAEIQKANLQRVDMAALPFDADTLKVSFTLRVLGNLVLPSACNDQEYQAELAKKINAYIAEHQFTELAARYAENIANGRFLWRNRVGAESVEVRVTHQADNKKTTWVFNSQDFNLREFTQPTGDLAELAEVIRLGLMGQSFAFLQVEGFVRLGAGQEVFPSQELVLDGGRDSTKSKYLYKVNEVAAMHSQKIGNALRTIDTWYPDSEELGPIAVEPYGSVTSRGKAYRQPRVKKDFYNLLDAWIIKGEVPAAEQQHYVIATLVRGGVFGEAG